MEVKKIRRAAAGFCTAAMMALNSVQSFAAAPLMWCATRQVDKLNNENFFFPGTVYVPGCLCNVF